MLSAMRTTAKSFVMKMLMGLLVISFAVWGVGDVLRSSHNSQLVTVGSEAVTYGEFARGVSYTQRMMEAMGMHGIGRNAIENQVLQRQVEEKLVEQRLRDAGLEVDQTLLARRVASASLFHDVQGKFDPALYQATLAQRQTTESAFLNDLKNDIRASLFTNTLSTEGIQPPAALQALYRAADQERRDAVLISIPASSIEVATPDATALQSYYDANKELLYQQPEKRTIEYVTFDGKELEKIAAKQVSDDAVKARIAENADAKQTPEQARAELQSEAMETVLEDTTTAIEDALAAGDSMGQAIAKAGLTAQSRVLKDTTQESNTATKDALLGAVVSQGFTLGEGDTSNLETTQDGKYYMLTVTAVTPATPKPFDSVKADVQIRTAQRARNKALREKAEEVKTALQKSDDWRAVAKQYSVIARPVSSLARTSKAAGMDPALVEAVFEHAVGDVAGPSLSANEAEIAKVTATQFVKGAAAPDKATSETLSQALQEEIIGSYYRLLTRRYPVEVNEKLLQQIRTQEGGA